VPEIKAPRQETRSVRDQEEFEYLKKMDSRDFYAYMYGRLRGYLDSRGTKIIEMADAAHAAGVEERKTASERQIEGSDTE
jgi:hypothetical protein